MFNDSEKVVPREFWYFARFVVVIVAATVVIVVESIVRLAKVQYYRLSPSSVVVVNVGGLWRWQVRLVMEAMLGSDGGEEAWWWRR
ncbi:hypothetical protein Tco_0122031 [Tanacetum coccineum]